MKNRDNQESEELEEGEIDTDGSYDNVSVDKSDNEINGRFGVPKSEFGIFTPSRNKNKSKTHDWILALSTSKSSNVESNKSKNSDSKDLRNTKLNHSTFDNLTHSGRYANRDGNYKYESRNNYKSSNNYRSKRSDGRYHSKDYYCDYNSSKTHKNRNNWYDCSCSSEEKYERKSKNYDTHRYNDKNRDRYTRRYSRDRKVRRSYSSDVSSVSNSRSNRRNNRSENWRDPYVRHKSFKNTQDRRSFSSNHKSISSTSPKYRSKNFKKSPSRHSSSMSLLSIEKQIIDSSDNENGDTFSKDKLIHLNVKPRTSTRSVYIKTEKSTSSSGSDSESSLDTDISDTSKERKAILNKLKTISTPTKPKLLKRQNTTEDISTDSGSSISDSSSLTSLSLPLRESDCENTNDTGITKNELEPVSNNNDSNIKNSIKPSTDEEKSKRKSDLLLQLDLIDKAILRKRSKKE
ncbi:hypothetical protein A3Q56_07999 [Intoshia linei]|uniref:Uncharacterized protein n=1 Tax=Intoshia linei TaxID=1819745 RepID=A0A177ASC4_9BILA|nr:hypothetical protein A3Q56_07999 [Intoshia linei]